MNRNFRFIFGIIAFLLLCPAVFGDNIVFSAQRVRSVYASGKEQTVLTGGAKVVTGQIEILAEELRISGKDQRYVESAFPVKIRDGERELTLQGDTLFYDREEDVLRIRGNAIMEDFKNEMVVRGGVLENRNKENIAIVQVGVRIFKKDITARAEGMTYRRDDDRVELTGLPVVYKNRDEYRASTIVIDIKTDEIELIGRVQGNVQTGSPSPSPSPGTTTQSASSPSTAPSASPSTVVDPTSAPASGSTP